VRKTLRLRGYGMPAAERTLIMGVLNVTPDSFSDGGDYMDPGRAEERALEMVEEGADIIDLGGESSRPGSGRVTEKEELARVITALKRVRKAVKVPISVDTRRSGVARAALDEGAAIINDITALRGDAAMGPVVSAAGAAVVLMHMRGTPGTMQLGPVYADVVEEITAWLAEAVIRAEEAGIRPDSIMVDPGIGFGKTTEHNLAILKDLEAFGRLGKPVLVGTSRKAFIGEITGREVGERVFGTAASVAAAILKGADVVRVHDISAMKDAAAVADAIRRAR
jgi:dihydropteroate synthase